MNKVSILITYKNTFTYMFKCYLDYTLNSYYNYTK